jgi:23S rRNA A2030 N6-methylase RlmJ
VECSCEKSNEPSGSIKYVGSSWVAAQMVASQEGLSSMELVNS